MDEPLLEDSDEEDEDYGLGPWPAGAAGQYLARQRMNKDNDVDLSSSAQDDDIVESTPFISVEDNMKPLSNYSRSKEPRFSQRERSLSKLITARTQELKSDNRDFNMRLIDYKRFHYRSFNTKLSSMII